MPIPKVYEWTFQDYEGQGTRLLVLESRYQYRTTDGLRGGEMEEATRKGLVWCKTRLCFSCFVDVFHIMSGQRNSVFDVSSHPSLARLLYYLSYDSLQMTMTSNYLMEAASSSDIVVDSYFLV